MYELNHGHWLHGWRTQLQARSMAGELVRWPPVLVEIRDRLPCPIAEALTLTPAGRLAQENSGLRDHAKLNNSPVDCGTSSHR